MKIKMLFDNDVFVLPKNNLLSNLNRSSEFDIRLLIYIAADENIRENFDLKYGELAQRLNCDKSDIDISLAFWRGAGVINISNVEDKHTKKDKDKKTLTNNNLPQYTGEEVTKIFENQKEISSLVDMCQQAIGKIFNTVEINTLISLYDYLKLDSEYIMILFAYCVKIGKKSIKSIEKIALEYFDKGIDTAIALEAYIKVNEDYKDNVYKLKKLFGIGERMLTSKENECFRNWVCEWYFSYEIISRAYEVTIQSIQSPSIPYTNKVLSSWNGAGYKTLEEIECSLNMYKKNKVEEKDKKDHKGSFDTDEFFELAIKRSYEDIK